MDHTSKQNYLPLYGHSKFCIKHGMRATKLHTVYQFGQLPSLARYFKYNAVQGTKAKTKLAKLYTKYWLMFSMENWWRKK